MHTSRVIFLRDVGVVSQVVCRHFGSRVREERVSHPPKPKKKVGDVGGEGIVLPGKRFPQGRC